MVILLVILFVILLVILCREIFIFYKFKNIKNENNKLIFYFVILLLAEFYQQSIHRNTMYRDFEDMEKIDRLDDERLRLLVENKELKKKLERKKCKIQDLKERVEELTKALSLSQTGLSVNDAERVQYEKEQQELYGMEKKKFMIKK